MRRHVLPRRPGGAAGTPSRRTALPVGRGQAPPYAVTALPPSASLAASVRAHWREFSMEGAEIGSLMICICTAGVLLYSSASPIQSLALSSGTSAALMGTAVASATYVIIRSPFGRRSGAHLNPGHPVLLVARPDTPLGRRGVHHVSFRRRRRWRPRRQGAVRHSVIREIGPVSRDRARSLRRRRCLPRGTHLVGAVHGHRTVCREPSFLDSLQSVVRSSRHRRLLCRLSVDLGLQRQPREKLRIAVVCVDMARHLDLSPGPVPGDADGIADIRRRHGKERRVLREGISRSPLDMSLSVSL